MTDYPFVPKSTASLEPGQFWSIPLSDGRFGCGRVLRVDRAGAGSRRWFIGAVHDWVGDQPPTADALAGAAILAVGHAQVESVAADGGAVLGIRPLDGDAIDLPAKVTSYWGVSYPRERAERRFIAGDPPPAWERRMLASPLTEEMLRPSQTGRGVVQFSRPLRDEEYERLAEWLVAYPEMTLRAYGLVADLEFLRFFPFVRRFSIDAAYGLRSLDGLRHLPDDLEHLGIGSTKARLDLTVLARFRRLSRLFLERQAKGIEVVSSLADLDELTLRSITLPDLALLVPLRRLRSLDVKLGGTRDLRLLPRVGELRYLELWLIRGLTDLSMIGELTELRYLFLQALKHVESLPDLGRCRNLRRIHLESMRGLRDLRPIAAAPGLEELVLDDMPQLMPGDLRPLAGHPRLRALSAGLGSRAKGNEVRAMFGGLEPVRGPFDWRTAP